MASNDVHLISVNFNFVTTTNTQFNSGRKTIYSGKYCRQNRLRENTVAANQPRAQGFIFGCKFSNYNIMKLSNIIIILHIGFKPTPHTQNKTKLHYFVPLQNFPRLPAIDPMISLVLQSNKPLLLNKLLLLLLQIW